MKKYLVLFLWLINSAYALDAVVIVLEAPLLKAPDLKSTVLQTLRKGQRVYVPREVASGNGLPEFIPTFDRVGNRAYVPSRFIKLITNSVSEYAQPITLEGHDPTDYRLEEKIPSTYPFANNDYLRASVAFVVGNNTQASYGFEPAYEERELKNEVGARILVSRKVTFDTYDRLYFGFLGMITNTENSIEFANANQSSESRAMYRGGPLLTYDTYKSENMRFSLGAGFTYNYNKSLISVHDSENAEDRIFSGFSISPIINSTFQIASVVPHTDLIAGADVSFLLPHTQKAQGTAEFPELWSENDEIKSSFKLQAALFFGIQVKY